MAKYAQLRAMINGSISDMLVEEIEYNEVVEEYGEGNSAEAFFSPSATDCQFVQWVELECDQDHKLPGQFGSGM